MHPIWNLSALYLKVFIYLYLRAGGPEKQVDVSLRQIGSDLGDPNPIHPQTVSRIVDTLLSFGLVNWKERKNCDRDRDRNQGVYVIGNKDICKTVLSTNVTDIVTEEDEASYNARARAKETLVPGTLVPDGTPLDGTGPVQGTKNNNHSSLSFFAVNEVVPARARVDESTPIDLPDAELYDYPEGYSEERVFEHYLQQKKKYKRNRFNDAIMRQTLQVLPRHPAIDPQLSEQDMRNIITQWMRYNIPFQPHQIFQQFDKFKAPYWEVHLYGASHANQTTTNRLELLREKRHAKAL